MNLGSGREPLLPLFTGEEFFQHKLPINPSQMTKWRKLIGEKGVERMLQLTIGAGLRTKTIAERSVDRVIVDTNVQPKVLISGTWKFGLTLKRQLRSRSAIEPVIGHMKSDGLLGRNFLKGMQGDAINALLCGAGHNLRKILARLRLLWIWLAGLLVVPQELKAAPQTR